MKRILLTALASLLAALGLTRGAAAPAAGAAEGPVVDAVWVERDIFVTYMAFTSYYSCEGLRDKVRWVLKELGARPDFKVTTRGCIRLSGPEVMPGVRIVAALPVEATPEVLAEIASGASKRELESRATGKALAEPEATARFPALRRRIEFRSQMNGPLEDGDCELIEQLRDQLIVPLGAKIIENSVRCAPRQVTLGAVRLTVEVLQPLPEP
jgi:hypothetical protein